MQVHGRQHDRLRDPTNGRTNASILCRLRRDAHVSAARWRVTFAIDNMLDKQYETAIGFVSIGRRGRIEVALEL
jgi:outer membrane cobalamin receptor